MPDQIWQAVTKQLESELGIPAKNVLLTATHSHSVPGQQAVRTRRRSWNPSGWPSSGLRAARIGYGTGVSYINVNRNIIDPKTKRWWEGPNYEGPSDKTVAVIKFESSERRAAGSLLQLRHARRRRGPARPSERRCSRDHFEVHRGFFRRQDCRLVVERRCRRSEPHLLSADLRPARDPHQRLRQARSDISNSMPPGGQGLNKKDPPVIKLMNQQKQMILSMGQFLGEEVMHVMRGMERMESSVRIDGQSKTVSARAASARTRAGLVFRESTRRPARWISGLDCFRLAIS